MVATAQSEYVLVVDDDDSIREMLCELIEMAGCRAISAANGAEGLKLLAEHRPCLVVLDVMMPVMGGRAMVEQMNRDPALASVPVVIATSAPSLAPSGFPVIRKPIDIELLWQYMRHTCTCTVPPRL